MKTLDTLIGGACVAFLAFYAGAFVQARRQQKETNETYMKSIKQIQDDIETLVELNRTEA